MSSPYNTHLPILEYALEHHNDFVLEFGGGEFSTPLIIKKSKESITFENNKEWYSRFKSKECVSHRVIHTDDYIGIAKEVYGEREQVRFSLAFIDGADWNERCSLVYYLRDKCDIIILHDSFPEHLNRCVNIFLDVFNNIFSMNNFTVEPYGFSRPEYPPTLVLSNYIDLNDWNIKNEVS